MHQVYFFARIFPYWAVPFAVVLGQLGLHFRRRHMKIQYSFWGLSSILLVSAIAWLVFRGDLHAEQWVRSVFES